MSQRPQKPSVTSSQHPLPFFQLDSRRFEDLCLQVAIQKYGLQNAQHPGRAGSDDGRDIEGILERNQNRIPVVIQAKRYEKISGKDLVLALEELYRNCPDFSGEFWLFTCASVSKKARTQLEKTSEEKGCTVRVIEGSVLEAEVRSLAPLLEEFFSTPITPLRGSLHQAAEKIIRRIQGFEIEFLREWDRSFSGNFELIKLRQKVMGDLLNSATTDLKVELAIFLSDPTSGVKIIESAAVAIMRYYRLAGQTTEDGLSFWEANEASKALLAMDGARAEFQQACKVLRDQMKAYLI